jgi:cation diffusion facilitator CzcD-associated flavoprotein CzcO
LATAASLRSLDRAVTLLERAPQIGASWRGHYDRLHLHTSKGLSGLPGLPLPGSYPKYPSRDQVVAYLEEYARHFGLAPQLSVEVRRIAREGDGWVVESSAGRQTARNVVIATGNCRVPHRPSWPGQEQFEGELLHSSSYKSGARLRGKRVLVIGFGNSGGEIAIDLHEQGALPELAVRGAVNVIPRDLFGIPILAVGIAMNVLPAPVADALSAPLLRLTVGDIRKLGLRKLPYGPAVQVERHGRIPLIDIGTLALVRSGALKMRPGVERFTKGGVVFEGGAEAAFDAVVLATGYRSRVGDFLEEAGEALDEGGAPRSSGRELLPGLWFCGFTVSPSGMLREIAREAEAIARGIAGRPPLLTRSSSRGANEAPAPA